MHLFEIKILLLFTVPFDEFKALSLNKSTNFFKNKSSTDHIHLNGVYYSILFFLNWLK